MELDKTMVNFPTFFYDIHTMEEVQFLAECRVPSAECSYLLLVQFGPRHPSQHLLMIRNAVRLTSRTAGSDTCLYETKEKTKLLVWLTTPTIFDPLSINFLVM